MSHKILIADDSLTIQKVIKITLANEPFEIAVCSNSAELEQSVLTEKPNIVLLDFNLSEDKTGYELSKEIHALASDVQILMLYGTFDTIDEDMLEDANVAHKIVKPFDGTKFINLCRLMAQQSASQGIQSISKEIVEDKDEQDFFDNSDNSDNSDDSFEPVVEEDISDDWVMNSPQTADENIEALHTLNKESEEQKSPNQQTLQTSALEKDLADWGMEVPGVIAGANQGPLNIPEVIEEAGLSQEEVDALAGGSFGKKANLNQAQVDNIVEDKNEPIIPDSSDLEYPDMQATQDTPKTGPTSKLISLDELQPEEPAHEAIELSDDTGEFVIENSDLGLGTSTEEEVHAIEKQIEDEVEEDLWKADGFEDSDQSSSSTPSELNNDSLDDIPTVEPHKLYEVMQETPELAHMVDQGAPSDFPADVMEESHEASFEVTEDLKEKLKEQLTPVVEDFVKQYCQENIEKIAWEVIPDLAENLIKKEIQKISKSILNP